MHFLGVAQKAADGPSTGAAVQAVTEPDNGGGSDIKCCHLVFVIFETCVC
jgi:hypothetical protein